MIYLPTLYHKNQQNVGRYTSPMDGMGMDTSIINHLLVEFAPQVGLHAETRAQLMLSEGYQAGPVDTV